MQQLIPGHAAALATGRQTVRRSLVLAGLVVACFILATVAALAPGTARADHGATQQCKYSVWTGWRCYLDDGAPIQVSKSTDVGYGKRIETTATLYRNGQLWVDTYGRNGNWFGALRPRTLIVAIDAAHRPIWVSRVFESQTLCGVLDVSCASERRETFFEQFPEAVGHHAARLVIYHADNPNYVDLRNSLIDGIKAAGDIAQAVKDELSKLQK